MKEARVYYTMRFGPLHFYINLVPRSHSNTEQPSGAAVEELLTKFVLSLLLSVKVDRSISKEKKTKQNQVPLSLKKF